MTKITQDMRYRQSVVEYAKRNGVAAASRKYNRHRSYIYFWLGRYDGTLLSLACHSRRPHSHPNAHTPEEIKLITDMRRRNPRMGLCEFWSRLRRRGYKRAIASLFRVMRRLGLFKRERAVKGKYVPKPYQQMSYPGERIQVDVKVVPRRCICAHGTRLYQYTAIDEFSRLRFLGAYNEQSSYSSADFLEKAVAFFARKGFTVSCVQTDNGFEFTNRFSNSKRNRLTLFEKTAQELKVHHKLIRPYTPRHNGKVERSHREDQKLLYNSHRFFSLDDFAKQLAVHQRRTNSLPMRPLCFLSPADFLVRHV